MGVHREVIWDLHFTYTGTYRTHSEVNKHVNSLWPWTRKRWIPHKYFPYYLLIVLEIIHFILPLQSKNNKKWLLFIITIPLTHPSKIIILYKWTINTPSNSFESSIFLPRRSKTEKYVWNGGPYTQSSSAGETIYPEWPMTRACAFVIPNSLIGREQEIIQTVWEGQWNVRCELD